MTTAPSTVLVMGATGHVGVSVVSQLLEAGAPVRALTRRPEEVRMPAGVDVVGGDLTLPDSLEAALHGVDVVFLVWTVGQDTLADVVARLAAHAVRVVLLTSPHRTPHPFFQQPNPMRALHVAIEEELAARQIRTTIVRPTMFASNVVAWWGPTIRAGDVIRWPYPAAETAPIDERDIAAVAVRALLDETNVGGDYVLTGPESLSQAWQVRIIARVIGRTIRFEEISPDEFRSEVAKEWPPVVRDMLLDAWRATLDHPALVTSTVEDITGRPARSFRAWVSDHVDAFR